MPAPTDNSALAQHKPDLREQAQMDDEAPACEAEAVAKIAEGHSVIACRAFLSDERRPEKGDSVSLPPGRVCQVLRCGKGDSALLCFCSGLERWIACAEWLDGAWAGRF